MPTIATDGRGNYVALDASGNWVPTDAPAQAQQGGGELGYPAAPPETTPQPWTAKTGNYPNVDEPGGGQLPVPQSGGAPRPNPFWTSPEGRQIVAGIPYVGPGLAAAGDVLGGVQQVGGDIVGAAQEGVRRTVGLIDPQLGRDVAALPEAFPLGGAELGGFKPAGPANYAEARQGANRTLLQTSPGAPKPVTLDELTGAVQRAPEPPQTQPNALGPGSGGQAQQPPPAGPQPTGTQGSGQFLDRSWLLQAGDAGGGAYDMGKGGDALVAEVRDALARGDTVRLVADQGRKTVPITKVNDQGMMVDDKGQPWGGASIAFDGTGREGVRITPSDAAGGPQPAGGPSQQPPPAGSQPGGAAPAGAQSTPASELGLTPREETAYRSTAEGNKLLEPQEPGVRDTQQYLPGEKINEAEASQDVQTARELKSLRQQTPSLDAQMTADETHNNNLRSTAINNTIPGQVQIAAAKTAREEAMKAAEPQVFGNATDADVQPVVQKLQDTLNDPKNRQNTQLQQYVKPLIDRLQNSDGTPKITDPRELWGFRQDVQHLTSNAAQRGDPNLSRVSGVLGGVLDTIDGQLEAAAPGYTAKIRDDYRTRSQQIDAMEALNAERFKLFDSQNKPNYNAVQGLMRRIVDARQAGDTYDPFTHVSQDTLDQLWNIRDSMRRSAAADRLAAPKGSPTTQNLGDALRSAGRMAVQGAAPVAGATIGSALIPIPGVGPAVGLIAGTAVNHLLSERALAQRYARGMQLLTPNELGPAAP